MWMLARENGWNERRLQFTPSSLCRGMHAASFAASVSETRDHLLSYTAGRGGGRKTLVEGERDRCLNCFFPRNSGTTQPHCSAEASPMIQCVVASRLSPPSSVLPFHSFLSAAEEHPIRISSLFSVSIPFWLNALFFSHSAKKRGGAGKRRYIKSFISSFSFSSFF